jgi:hypothetical protein
MALTLMVDGSGPVRRIIFSRSLAALNAGQAGAKRRQRAGRQLDAILERQAEHLREEGGQLKRPRTHPVAQHVEVAVVFCEVTKARSSPGSQVTSPILPAWSTSVALLGASLG